MFEIEKVNYFSCHDLEEFIREYYGREVDLLEPHAENYGNNTFVDINVCKDYPDDSWWVESEELRNNPDQVIRWWIDDADEFHDMFDRVYVNEAIILWDLCRKDVIPEGKYVMKAWW